MAEAMIPVKHKVGLHARPASLFVQTAAKFSSAIKVKNLSANGNFVDAKSIIMVLTLGVMKDHEIQIQAEGADEADAVAALQALINNNFGES
ncbi:MAG: HPr family phosphocarrier protein [Chloroflexi bacterium]|nr:HPr family phosphocarrier protein [Chloroflexota bacterium]